MQQNISNSNWWRRCITLEKCLLIIFILLATQLAEEHKSTALASGRGKASMPDAAKNIAGSSPRKRLSTDSKQEVQKSELLPVGPSKRRMSDSTKNIAGSSPRKRLSTDSKQEVQKSELLPVGPSKRRMSDTTKNIAGSSPRKILGLDSKQKDDSTSDELRRTAQEVLSKMNEHENPCNNFYKFACGKYIETTEIPDDEGYMNQFVKLHTQVREQLKNIVAHEPRPQPDSNYMKLPNLLYKGCMNEKLIEDMSTKYIETISVSLGGWPVIVGESWDKDKTWTWQETVKKFRRLGFNTNILLTLSVAADLKEPTKHIIDLDQLSALKLQEENPYHKYMVDIAVLLGAERQAAERELRESLEFEIALRKVALSPDEMRNPNALYNPFTIEELQKMHSYVQWLDYIKAILPEGSNINENTIINLVVPSYLDQLGKLLLRTNKRVLANYMMWRMHEEVLFGMPQKFREAKFKYESTLTGKQRPKQRWMDCIDFISDRLKFATGSMYVRKYFPKDSKAAASAMIGNIRNTFSKTFDGLDWMDQITKKEAKKKLDAMKAAVGYTEELLNNAKLEEYYRKLQIYPDKLMQSILNMNVFFEDKSLNELRLPVAKNDWTTLYPPQIVNGAYDTSLHRLEIPAAILQGNFFNPLLPKYMNYGAIGSFIGHEITHAFDDEGRQFDTEGRLVDWWQPNTEKAFLEKAQCFIKQYSDFSEEQTGININGDSTQGENIADNGGFKYSYLAYNQWLGEHGEELPLPELTKFSSRQMFWISAAQTWCAKYRKDAIKSLIIDGDEVPEEFRVCGAFQNIDAFSSDFKCPPNSRMNPAHKCKIW